MRYCFFDTETAGLPKNFSAPTTDVDNWPRLVQLSWILTDERKEVFIIRPDGFTIPEEASNVHGITTERASESRKPSTTSSGRPGAPTAW